MSSIQGAVILAVLVVATVAGASLVYSDLTNASSSTSTIPNAAPVASQSTNPTAPPDISQYCTLPLVSANSSSGMSMTLSNPHCGYYMSPELYGGSVGMVSNESLDISISGPPSTAVSLAVPKTPFGAAWFTSGSSITTDSQGEAQTTLYLAGMWVNPRVTSNYTVRPEVVASDSSSVSLKLPVVQSSTLTGLNPTGPIDFPAVLSVEPANYSQGISYRTPFAVVYLPDSSSAQNLNLSVSVIGLASGNATSPGPIQPLPSWLNVWFADGNGNKETSLTLEPYKIGIIFLSADTTMNFPLNTLKVYNVAIHVTENGASFTEVARVAITSPTLTK